MDGLRFNRCRALSRLLVVLTLLATGSTLHGQASDSPDAAARDYYSANGLLSRGLNELAAAEYRKFLEAHSSHEKAALARYGLGVALFRLKQYEPAVAELQQCASKPAFEFSAETQLLLGQAYLALQKFAEAAQSFQTVLEKHADHPSADAAAALLAEALYRDQKFKEVGAACDMIARRWPSSAMRDRADFFHGLAAAAVEDFDSAAKILSGLRERNPKSPYVEQSALLLAQSFHRAGNVEAAEREYRALIKQTKSDEAADALFGLATLLQAQSRSDEAAQSLDQFQQRFPKHKLMPLALLQRGRIWFEAEQFERGLKSFEQAAKIDSSADEPAYWIAKCHLRLEQFDVAAATLDDALRRFPKSRLLPEMTYDRAVALVRAGKNDKAATALEQFRAAFPDHALAADALYLHAMAEHAQRNFAVSRELCARFLKAHKDHALAAAVTFLAAENELLADRPAQAADAYSQFIAQFPKDANASKARYRLGSALHRLQRFDEAEAALRAVVNGRTTQPEFRQGVLLLGDIAFQRGQWQQAADQFSDYLSFGSDSTSADEATLKLGLCQQRLNQHDSALATFQSLLKTFPKTAHRAQAIFEQGQILLSRNDLDAAQAAFESLLKSGEKSRFFLYARNHLAGIAMTRGEHAKAAEIFALVAKESSDVDVAANAAFQRGVALLAARRPREAADAFARFVEQYPKHERASEAAMHRAVATARAGDHAAAIKLIDQCESMGHADVDPALAASLAYEKAWCLRELKRPDEAAKAYEALIASFADQPIVLNAMLEQAELHTAAKQHREAAEALQSLRSALANRAKEAPAELREQALYRLAACRYELGEFDTCAALCGEFIQAHPNSSLRPSAHIFCGEALLKLDQPAKAAPHFAAIIEKNPADPAVAASMLRLGECQARNGQWSESERTFERYLSRFADSELWFQAQFGMGWARENQGHHDDAIAAYRKVAERHTGPTAARAQFQIGECLFATRRFDEAVRELLKVDILYAYPEWSAASLYEAGRCFEELSKSTEARTQFEQVRQRFPESRWAQLAQERLSGLSGRTAAGG